MKNTDILVPDLTIDLIEWLEQIFPDKTPGLSDSLDAIRFKSGQVNVVRFLREQFNRQMESVLAQAK